MLQLPPYVLRESISCEDFPGAGKNSAILVPMTCKPERDKTEPVAKAIAHIAKINTGFPYDAQFMDGGIGIHHRYRIGVAGSLNPFIHLPAYFMDVLLAKPDSFPELIALQLL